MSGETNIIGFPGLGIDRLEMNPVAFNIFGRDIAWYGIIITLGIIAGFFYVLYRSKFEGLTTDDVLDYAIFGIIPSIICARLYYVLFNLSHYKSFMDVIAIWNGGIAIYGGIIGAVGAVLIISAVKKLKPTKVFDMVMPAIMLGQIIGRWGNFVNVEAFGGETSALWRMAIYQRNGFVYPNAVFVHPTFLYEALWNLAGFVIINIFYKKKKFDGQISLVYAVWYGIGRAVIEGMRTDSLMLGDFRVSQLLAVVSAIAALVALIVFTIVAGQRSVDDDLVDDALMIDSTNAGEELEESVRELPLGGDENKNKK